jgi:hypothetical protein
VGLVYNPRELSGLTTVRSGVPGVLQKHHPHVLGFDCDLNLGIGGPCNGFNGAC